MPLARLSFVILAKKKKKPKLCFSWTGGQTARACEESSKLTHDLSLLGTEIFLLDGGCYKNPLSLQGFLKAFNEFPVQKSKANRTASQPALHLWRIPPPVYLPFWSSKGGAQKVNKYPKYLLFLVVPATSCVHSRASFPWSLHRDNRRKILCWRLSH